MYTLRYVRAPKYADVRKIQLVHLCTLNKLEIHFKYVTDTLQYGGIRCHSAKGSQKCVHAYTLDIK